jgi:ankyrin repeat protein
MSTANSLTRQNLFLILLKVPYPDLSKICTLKREYLEVCKDEDFWNLKTIEDWKDIRGYEQILRDRDNYASWKNLYQYYYGTFAPEELYDLIRSSEPSEQKIKPVKKLLDLGVDPNTAINDKIPILATIFNDEPEILQLLLRAGADPNLPDANGVTPVSAAASAGYIEMAEILLEGGADPNIPDIYGDTPLMAVLKEYQLDFLSENQAEVYETIVEILLEAGADPNMPDGEGATPLSYAINIQDADITLLLLDFGADPIARSFQSAGRSVEGTPFSVAERINDPITRNYFLNLLRSYMTPTRFL